jgi:hypothetical protein
MELTLFPLAAFEIAYRIDAFVKIVVDRARQVEITNGLNKYLYEINMLHNQET